VFRLAVTTAVFLSLTAGPEFHRVLARSTSDRQTWAVPLPATRRLSATITIGDVRILGERRDDALIEVVRTAPTTEGLARVPVRVDQADAQVTVSAIQEHDGKDPAYRTDVTLRVPRDASLGPVQIGEGRLTLSSLGGNVQADVRRGSIDAADVQGTLRLETSLGDIVVNRARLIADGLLRLRTFNGDVRLTFAERPVDARILALALNGTIESEIPLRLKDTWGPRWGEASLGKGEPVVSIDVVTGKIVIRSDK
jgi:hypothetical protein